MRKFCLPLVPLVAAFRGLPTLSCQPSDKEGSRESCVFIRGRTPMVCFLLCSDSPDGINDPFAQHANEFQVPLMSAPCEDPLCCVFGFLPCGACYNAYVLRKRALGGNMQNYECCQGYMPACCCIKPGKMGESSCPECCLFAESCCCLGLSMSSTRMFVQDMLGLRSDPTDRRLIRCNNCLMALSCICNILAIVNDSFSDLAALLDCIADCFFYSLLGCMNVQIRKELDAAEAAKKVGVPAVKTMSSKQARAMEMAR